MPIQLTFQYNADGKENVIDSYIHTALLYIYDKNGKLCSTLSVTKSQLVHEGVKLNLPFGQYTLVSWGNIGKHTVVTHNELLKTGRISTPEFNNRSVIPTNDSLYQSRLEFVVEEQIKNKSIKNNVLHFNSAHIRLEIYVRSLFKPHILVHNLMPEYNLMMGETQPFQSTYTPIVEYLSEEEVYATLFYVYRFRNDNPIQVEISIPRDPSISCIIIDLEKYMAEQDPPLLVEGIQEVTIPLLIELHKLGISYKFPEWLIKTGSIGIE